MIRAVRRHPAASGPRLRRGSARNDLSISPQSAFAIEGLGKRFKRTWALRDCTLAVAAGRVVALVGPNGSGKTTLLHLLAGLLSPTTGTVEVAGQLLDPGSAETLAQIGILPQRRPLYPSFTVSDMLRFGAVTNPSWDGDFTRERIDRLGIPLHATVGHLSGGERTQVALALALGKRPGLLLLDEPLSDLDPLARREVMSVLLGDVAERGTSVVLSTHVLPDIEKTCDWLVLLQGGRVVLTGDIETILDDHVMATGAAAPITAWGRETTIVDAESMGRDLVALARHHGELPMIHPGFVTRPVTLEEVVLGHLRARTPQPHQGTPQVRPCSG